VEKFMAAGGIPAVCMQTLPGGECYVQCDDDIYTVYPYIEQAKAEERDYRALGSMLARIHLRGSDSLPDSIIPPQIKERDPARVLIKLTEYREQAAKLREAIDAEFLTYIDRKLELHKELTTPELDAKVLVHGDYHIRNLLFSMSGELVGICDWEKAELAPRAYEIARSVQYICFENRQPPYEYERELAIQSARNFLEEYRAVSPITVDELSRGFALRLRKLIASFWIEETHYGRTDFRADKFVASETKLLQEFTDGALVDSIVV
jgi:aminoglycoside phosphotransferase (APT) family kinase protein